MRFFSVGGPVTSHWRPVLPHPVRRLVGLLIGAWLLWPLGLAAQQPLTLDDVLREAQRANAQLPVSALGVDIVRNTVRELRASRWPRFSMESGVSMGAPLAYTTSQGQLQLVGGDTLFTGGLRRANLRAANYQVQAASAGLRMTQKDIDFAVRLRFVELLEAEDEIAVRGQGIERLQNYLAQIEARRAAGQPVGSDVVTTQVRLGTEEATLADAERVLDGTRLQLNELMGRDPAAPLTVVPLPPPAPPALAPDSAWLAAPEIRLAAAGRAATEAGIAATQSERRPQLSVSANLGVLPVFADSNAGTGLNSGSGFGGALVLSLSWPFLDGGAYRARLERAQAQARQARDSEIVVMQQTRLAWRLAGAERTRLYQQVQIWARNVPLARDAYLQTQSMYAGGAATALEVLDAFSAWINVSTAYANTMLRYRQAEANAIRWGTP
jgi:outer membrane protein TolC